MKAKITYARLQERVAAAAGIPTKEAQTLLREMSAAVGAGLVADGKVNLAGLGRFNRKVQSARRGRNPQTGEPLDIPEKNRVDFLPEAKWRRMINREFEPIPVVPEPSPGTSAQPAAPKARPPRKRGAAHPAEPQKPRQPVEPEVVAAVTSAPASPAADADDISPAEASDRPRRPTLVPAIGVILLVVAALIFLWPRAPHAPEPPTATRPVPTSAAVSESPGPPESRRPAPGVTAAAPEAPALEPAAGTDPVTTPATAAPEPVPVPRYAVAAGDSLWKIAGNVYQFPYFWPAIFQENHKTLEHPDSLIVGMQLAIPAFEGRLGQLAESDFQKLADGYLQVYQVYQRHQHPQAAYYLWVAYRLRAHWIPDNEVILGNTEDLQFIRQLKGRGLIH